MAVEYEFGIHGRRVRVMRAYLWAVGRDFRRAIRHGVVAMAVVAVGGDLVRQWGSHEVGSVSV